MYGLQLLQGLFHSIMVGNVWRLYAYKIKLDVCKPSPSSSLPLHSHHLTVHSRTSQLHKPSEWRNPYESLMHSNTNWRTIIRKQVYILELLKKKECAGSNVVSNAEAVGDERKFIALLSSKLPMVLLSDVVSSEKIFCQDQNFICETVIAFLQFSAYDAIWIEVKGWRRRQIHGHLDSTSRTL